MSGLAAPTLDIVVDSDPAGVAARLAKFLRAEPPAAAPRLASLRIDAPVAGFRRITLAGIDGAVERYLSHQGITALALAWSVRDRRMIDPFGGERDIAARALRLVRPDSLDDDPVLALDAMCLRAETGFALAGDTVAAIRRAAPHIPGISPERARDSFAAILDSRVAAVTLREMDALGLLDALLPELIPARGCLQPKDHYWDVFDHLIETVAVLDCLLDDAPSAAPRSPERHPQVLHNLSDFDAPRERYNHDMAPGRTHRAMLKLAALLHDVSKPETRTRQPDGRIRFFGHDDLGAMKAAAVMERLRFSRSEIDLVHRLIADHLRPGQIGSRGQPPTERALDRFFRDLGDAALDLLLLNLADHAAARGPLMPTEDWARHVAYIRWLLAQRHRPPPPAPPAPLVTGRDLMAALQLEPGPAVGRLLHAIDRARAAGRISTRDQALALAHHLHTDGAQTPEVGNDAQ
jgi:putative nucleotidyltransferase with HDIG domain